MIGIGEILSCGDGVTGEIFVAVTGDENDFFVAEAGRSVIALSKMLPKVRAAFE